ncbi:MAG: class I SAM-dependent methyltransferase [Planctomycetota bacterium]
MPVDPDLLETYFRLMNSNGLARAYHSAVESGILGAIARGPQSISQVCETCETTSRGTGLLLDAMVACGLAEQEGDTYRATVIAQMMLFGEYRNLGNKYWDHLDSFLRDGQPLVRMDDPSESEKHYARQAAILGWMLSPAAAEAAQILKSDDRISAGSVLDVGAGSAVWSLALAGLDDATEVTVNDWPTVLETARESADALGLAGRVNLLAGDFHKVDFPPAAFDLAIVANVAHLETLENFQSLMRRIADSLRTSGAIVVIDVVIGDGAGRDRTAHALYAIGLALRTEQGCVHQVSDLKSCLENSGFSSPEFVPLESPPYMLGMLVAFKS